MRAAKARLADGSRLITDSGVASFRAHALEAYPEECLGFVDRDGAYRRVINAHPDPRIGAVMASATYADLSTRGDLGALCHSHPDGLDCPSEADMRAQHELMVPFLICSTNGQATADPFAWGDQLIDDRDLVGRPFRHAVDDCYALVRAHWWVEHGVLLPDYPRNWEWWRDATSGSKDLYRRFFADAGFYEIRREEVVPGDAWLAAVRSEVPNHAGVYLDGGLALHHPSSGLAHDPARLSKREPMARWMPYATHWLRR